MKIALHGKRAGLRVWKMVFPGFLIACLIAAAVVALQATEPPAQKPMTMAEIVAAAKPEDWRALDPENTLYLELAGGRVVIELSPAFAPQHAANVKALAREHYYDGLAIIRVQDNYVAQWGDPEADNPQAARKIQRSRKTLAAEFDRAGDGKIPFALLPDGDVYAGEAGFFDGFPVARDKRDGKMWLCHCYGMVGAARGDPQDSGGGAEVYVVIGQAPRHLDRNVTLFGQVVQGMELLSSLPRGSGPMGFYDKPEQMVPIKSIRVAADVPSAERSDLEVMRTDSDTFLRLVESRRNRREGWFLFRAGRIDLCNIPIPVRKKAGRSGTSH
jgi:peptidylprolyl isomerase